MHKILTAIAVVALGALSTSVIATILLHSAAARQSRQISALATAEHSDNQKIAVLQSEMSAATKHKKLTAAQRRCMPLPLPQPQPIGQPGLLLAAPRLVVTIRHAC
jgi:hypothetical protein